MTTQANDNGLVRWGVAEPEANWLVAVVNPNCHARAASDLRRLKYRVFYPQLKKWVSHARVKRAVKRPLLGRYLFVDIPAEKGTELARRCNGVGGFVSVGGVPIRLPDNCVPDMMRREMEGEWNFVDKADLPIGARVRIMEGEFADLLATLVSHRKGRCSVKLLGTNTTKTMYPLNLRAA